MKYFILIVIALLLSLIESTVGDFRPFAYITLTLTISIFLYWSFDSFESLVYLGIGGLFFDLFSNNWIGSSYLAFFLPLLILAALNSFIDIFGETKKVFASSLHLLLSMLLSYFLVLFQYNNLKGFSVKFLIINLLTTIIIYLFFWLLLEGKIARRKSLYV